MTTSQLGRTKSVVWPDLNEPVDWVPGVQSSVTELSNNANMRYEAFASIADSTTSEVDHNMGLNLTELTVIIATGSGTNLTYVSNPIDAGWAIAEKTGSEKTVIEVTTPSSGGPHTFVVFVIHSLEKRSRAAVDNVSVSSNITLQNKTLNLVDTSAARTLTLPAVDALLFITVKDVTGSASTNNITINTPGAETIDGAASFALDSDYMGVDIISDGTNYFVL